MLLAISLSILVAAADPPPVLPCGEPPPGMSCVPGGYFERGLDDDRHACKQRFGANDERPNARPAARVWVQSFYIDRTEVTYEAYASCIRAKKCSPRPEDGRFGPRYTDFDRPDQPITGVNWYQAREYCKAHGKTLPTEAQWEKAARGPDGERFPWGDEPVSCAHAVIKDDSGRSCGVKKRGTASIGRVLEVGSKGAKRYGVSDLIGNVEEWVADWYSDDYEECGESCAGIEPRGPCDGAEECPGHRFKIVRGGSWYYDAGHATSWHRRPHFPDNRAPDRFHHFGFRCAKAVKRSTDDSTGTE